MESIADIPEQRIEEREHARFRDDFLKPEGRIDLAVTETIHSGSARELLDYKQLKIADVGVRRSGFKKVPGL
jgi:hypothetical protein